MKFSTKLPATNPVLSQELESNGWKKIKEPKSISTILLLALPISWLIMPLELFYLSSFFSPVSDFFDAFNQELSLTLTFDFFQITILFIACFDLILFHEFIHALFIPNFFTSEKSIWGITWFGGYVATTDQIKKGRFKEGETVLFVHTGGIFELFSNKTEFA